MNDQLFIAAGRKYALVPGGKSVILKDGYGQIVGGRFDGVRVKGADGGSINEEFLVSNGLKKTSFEDLLKANKTIDFKVLESIIRYLDIIWLEEDEDFPDGRKIRNYERAIENRFKILGADEQMQKDILETHRVLDSTFKEQCDRLRERGYVIVNNGGK